MDKLQHHWKRVPVAVRKPLVLIIGGAIVGAGLIMLVTPGPGWAAIFVGFAILATEFAFAEKVRDWLVARLKAVIAWARRIWAKVAHRKRR